MVMFMFYLILYAIEKNNTGTYISIAFIFPLLYCVHLIIFIFSMLIYLISIIVQYHNSIKNIFLRILPLIPSLVILYFYSMGDFGISRVGIMEFFLNHYFKVYFGIPIIHRSLLFVGINYGLFDGIIDYLVALLFSLFIIYICFGRYILSWSKFKAIFKLKISKQLWVLFFLSLVITLFAPPIVQLFQRFPVFWHLSIILIGSVLYKNGPNKMKIILICTVCLIHFALWVDYMIGFQKDNIHFNQDTFKKYAVGETMGGLMYDYKYRGTKAYLHSPMYFIVWNKGISTSYSVDDNFGKIGRKLDFKLLPKFMEWDKKYRKPYENEYQNLDMILIRGEIPDSDKHWFNESRLIDIGSNFYIYRN